MIIFRQLFDLQSSTYTYLLADPEIRSAVLIDPVFEQARRDAALLNELDLTLLYTLDTHVHADHVTGAWLMARRTGCKIALSAHSGAKGADRYLEDGDKITFGRRSLVATATPGHTDGCMSYVLDDRSMVFTGDALLIRGAGRCDFQQGNSHTLYRSVHDRLLSLPDGCLVYPGHDYRGLTSTSIWEEKKFNPRLGGERSEDDFAGYMDNLGLPHPKKIDVAVPANLVCGEPPDGETPDQVHDWAPLNYTFAGIWEIDPQWIEEHRHDIQVLDVRETAEFDGPHGRIPGALPIPIGELEQRVDELSRDIPVVTVCRSGGRSTQATVILSRAGFEKVANLAGGMLRWRAQGLGVDGAID